MWFQLSNLHRRQNPWDGLVSAWDSLVDDKTQPTTKDEPSTIYRTVFTTMTDGWDGDSPLTTLSPDNSWSSIPDVLSTDSSEPSSQTPNPTTLPSSVSPSSQSIPSTLAVATNTPSQTSDSEVGATTSPSSVGSTSSDSGLSGAAKAGIAFGVIAGFLAVVLIVFFIFQRRRKQMEERLDDGEKNESPFSDSNAIAPQNGVKAPRLSLRPVTQFMPNLQRQPQHPDRRQSRGAMIAMVQNPQSPHPPAGQTLWDRPMSSNSNHRDNPFGNNAERLPNPIAEEVSPVSPANSGFGSAAQVNKPTPSLPTGGPSAAGGAAVAGAAVAAAGLTRKTSIRKDGPPPLDLTINAPLAAVPPSPAGTEFSVNEVAPGQAAPPSAGAAAIAAAGGPPTSAVHRVQLDFKPTLEDEMGLRAGQLVRLLHEYDDGWALCIRLDRSQQGVVPRTCLSTRPVKPRPPQNGGPRGPPVNPQRGPNYPGGQRPLTPQGGPPRGYPRPESPVRPGTAPGGRPQSPAGRPMSPYGRPASPGGRAMSPGPGPRSQSPGPRYQQGRPQSPNGMGRRQSPPGPSQMNQQYRPGPGPNGPPTGPVGRKPVPGQAY